MVVSEARGQAEALRRIAACRTAQAEELDLGGLQLTALDGELLAALCQLGWLRRLFLGLSAEARKRAMLRGKLSSSRHQWIPSVDHYYARSLHNIARLAGHESFNITDQLIRQNPAPPMMPS